MSFFYLISKIINKISNGNLQNKHLNVLYYNKNMKIPEKKCKKHKNILNLKKKNEKRYDKWPPCKIGRTFLDFLHINTKNESLKIKFLGWEMQISKLYVKNK